MSFTNQKRKPSLLPFRIHRGNNPFGPFFIGKAPSHGPTVWESNVVLREEEGAQTVEYGHVAVSKEAVAHRGHGYGS